MLNSFVSKTVDDDGNFDPDGLAKTLGVSVNELAKLVGVSRNTLVAKPLGSRGRDVLSQLVKILALATEATGNERRAVIWFRYNPIISLGTKTPMEHVADGHADWVLGHIENVLNGVYA